MIQTTFTYYNTRRNRKQMVFKKIKKKRINENAILPDEM